VLHFIYTDFVASLVPPWIPWHLFWTYFTAVTIFAAGLAIVFRKQSYWAAILLGIEILLFCALIHLKILFHRPDDPWATRALFGDLPGRVINAFKDFGLGGAVLLFAGTQASPQPGRINWPLRIGQAIVAISLIAFGLLHFLYPAFAPGIEPISASVPFPIPGGSFWVYLTGAALVAGGLILLMHKESLTLTAFLGTGILLFELLTWLPRFASNPGDLTGNWLKDLGIIGGVLVLAGTRHQGGLTTGHPGVLLEPAHHIELRTDEIGRL
jgi:uncharacterized membrane protein